MLSLKSSFTALSAAFFAAALTGCATTGMSDVEKLEAQQAKYNFKLSKALNICMLFGNATCMPDSDGPVESQSSALGSAVTTAGFHGADIVTKGFTGITGAALGFGLVGFLFSGGDGVDTTPRFMSYVPVGEAATHLDARVAISKIMSDALAAAYRKQGFKVSQSGGTPYGKYVFTYVHVENDSKGCPKDLDCEMVMTVYNTDHLPALENPISLPSWLGQPNSKFFQVDRTELKFRWDEKKVKKLNVSIDWDQLWLDVAAQMPEYTYLHKAPRKLDYKKYTVPAMLTRDKVFFFAKPKAE